MAIKLEGGGGKTLVARLLVARTFFCGFPNTSCFRSGCVKCTPCQKAGHVCDPDTGTAGSKRSLHSFTDTIYLSQVAEGTVFRKYTVVVSRHLFYSSDFVIGPSPTKKTQKKNRFFSMFETFKLLFAARLGKTTETTLC